MAQEQEYYEDATLYTKTSVEFYQIKFTEDGDSIDEYQVRETHSESIPNKKEPNEHETKTNTIITTSNFQEAQAAAKTRAQELELPEVAIAIQDSDWVHAAWETQWA